MTLPEDEPLPETVLELLRRDEPTPRAIEAAYLRYATRRREPRASFKYLRWFALGFAAGCSVAYAATGEPPFGARWQPRTDATAPSPHARAAPVEGARATPAEHARAPAAEAPSASPALESATPPELSTTSPRSVAAQAVPRGAPPGPTSRDPKWQRAAAALQAHDYDAAEAALRELETSGAARDRDAASLALAQVLLRRGRDVEGRARLERLSTHASSTPVREQARALLDDFFASGGRSVGTPVVPQ